MSAVYPAQGRSPNSASLKLFTFHLSRLIQPILNFDPNGLLNPLKRENDLFNNIILLIYELRYPDDLSPLNAQYFKHSLGPTKKTFYTKLAWPWTAWLGLAPDFQQICKIFGIRKYLSYDKQFLISTLLKNRSTNPNYTNFL